MGPVAPQPQARPRIPVNLPPSAASSTTLGPNTAAFRLLIVLNLEQHNDLAITSILLTVRHLDHWASTAVSPLKPLNEPDAEEA